MKRYIKECANDFIKTIKENELMQPDIKARKIETIEKSVILCERGIITKAEALKMIIEA